MKEKLTNNSSDKRLSAEYTNIYSVIIIKTESLFKDKLTF